MVWNREITIDTTLVSQLVTTQFPEWAHLTIEPVQNGGWDNRVFRLGKEMLVRMPSREQYSLQVEKEQFWLPKLAPYLPLQIPFPLAMGEPTEFYPWHWSIYKWLDGETAIIERIDNLDQFAIDLGKFLLNLQQIDTVSGPLAGPHNFYRGGPLITYDKETREAIFALKSHFDPDLMKAIWESALATKWQKSPVWVHGDISAENLLVKSGKLSAVIDFGCLGIGDPACDLAIAWTFFNEESRRAFRRTLQLDEGTWARGRGWTLWKALITCASLPNVNHESVCKSKRIINDLVDDFDKTIC